MRLCGWLILNIFALSLVVFCYVTNAKGDGAEARPVDFQKYKACGVCALYECARIRGNTATLEQLYEILHPANDGTNTLAELAIAAERIGFLPIATKLSYQGLLSMPTPSIVHVREVVGEADGNHFVVYLGATGRGHPVILDAPAGPNTMSQAVFRGRWTGNALILCESQDEASRVLSLLSSPPWTNMQTWSVLALIMSALGGALTIRCLSRRVPNCATSYTE
jgi:ABC-type bacteriocin/lantibiotic exporter with double-glycine peptidase domain